MPNSPKTLLEYLVSNIVENKDQAVVEDSSDSYGNIILKITVSKEDMGLIIGKGGKTIRAIRNLVKSLSIKQQIHTSVILTEEY